MCHEIFSRRAHSLDASTPRLECRGDTDYVTSRCRLRTRNSSRSSCRAKGKHLRYALQVSNQITAKGICFIQIPLSACKFMCDMSRLVGNPVPDIITACHVVGRPHRSAMVTAGRTHGSLATADRASVPTSGTAAPFKLLALLHIQLDLQNFVMHNLVMCRYELIFSFQCLAVHVSDYHQSIIRSTI